MKKIAALSGCPISKGHAPSHSEPRAQQAVNLRVHRGAVRPRRLYDGLVRRIRRKLLLATAVLVAVHLVLSGGLYWAMRQTPDKFGRIMTHVPMPMMLVLPFETLWMRARAGNLEAGAMAPDFSLPTLDHAATVQLSSFRGAQPVVLVFGSYT
jgi:hypothetical protein